MVNFMQITIHLISIVFIYLLFKKRHPEDISHFQKNPLKDDFTVDKEVRKCLQSQCVKAATETECNKYARCKWDNGCKPKAVQCDELEKNNCNQHTDCILNNTACSWNHKVLPGKIINETSSLNKYCFKRRGAFDLKNVNEYVEDNEYIACIDDESNTTEECKQKAKVKLECNHLKNHVYDGKFGDAASPSSMKRFIHQSCKKIIDDKGDGCSDHEPHSHHPIEFPDSHLINGKRRVSHIFEIKHDNLLELVLKIIAVMFILILNFTIAVNMQSIKF